MYVCTCVWLICPSESPRSYLGQLTLASWSLLPNVYVPRCISVQLDLLFLSQQCKQIPSPLWVVIMGAQPTLSRIRADFLNLLRSTKCNSNANITSIRFLPPKIASSATAPQNVVNALRSLKEREEFVISSTFKRPSRLDYSKFFLFTTKPHGIASIHWRLVVTQWDPMAYTLIDPYIKDRTDGINCEADHVDQAILTIGMFSSIFWWFPNARD